MSRLLKIAFGLLLMLSSWLLAGCIHLRAHPDLTVFSAAPPSPACAKLEEKVVAYNLSSIVAGGLATIAAAGAGIFDEPVAARATMASGGAFFSLLGGVTSYLATYNAAKFAKECPQ